MTERRKPSPLAARVLAECEAKRRIVARCEAVGVGFPSYALAEAVLCHLAEPYTDHPDYDEAWRP